MKASRGSENTEVISTNGLQNTKGKDMACLYGPCPARCLCSQWTTPQRWLEIYVKGEEMETMS